MAGAQLTVGQWAQRLGIPDNALPEGLRREDVASAETLRALATATRQRVAEFPALPTMIEAGVPNYEASVWNGVLAPTGTPRDIITRLNLQITQAVKEITPALADIGAYPMASTPEEFAAFMRAAVGKWAKVVKLSGARAD